MCFLLLHSCVRASVLHSCVQASVLHSCVRASFCCIRVCVLLNRNLHCTPHTRAHAGPPSATVHLVTPSSPSPGTAVATNAAGQWEYTMPPRPSGWNVTMSVTHTPSGSTDVVTVSFGETLVCSGQSNVSYCTLRAPCNQFYKNRVCTQWCCFLYTITMS